MLHTILVPLDGSALSEQALPTAAALAQASGAQLVLVQAVGTTAPSSTAPRPAQVAAIRTASIYLSRTATRLSATGLTVQTAVPYAPPAEGILRAIDIWHVDLVVMTTHGRSGPGHWAYGSVAETVLAHSPVPVWLMRGERLPAKCVPVSHQSANLLVPLDGSAFAETVLPYMTDIARALNWTIILMRVVTPPLLGLKSDVPLNPVVVEQQLVRDEAEAHDYLAAMAAQLRHLGVTVETHVCIGQTIESILEESWLSRVALVAMATHGASGRARLLYGSVAYAVLNRGACPLLLVRPTAVAQPYPVAQGGLVGEVSLWLREEDVYASQA